MMFEGRVGKMPSGEMLRVREVWHENLDAEMRIIEGIVEDYPFLAMDTEFPGHMNANAHMKGIYAGVVVKPVGDFKTAGAYQYKTIRTNVDILKLIQLGLTFCNGKGELPVYSNERCVWQFNFREFDLEKDMYAPESIKLLVDSGIDFKANVARGVDQARFAELLMTSGVVLNSDVMWITFHSGYDFGYLLKLMTGTNLPATEKEFTEQLKVYFPKVWDMKYVMSKKNLHGGLQKVASQLGVERIGPQHQAGSDSLLTSNTFMKLVEQHFKGLEEALSHIGILYQLGEDGDRPVYERP